MSQPPGKEWERRRYSGVRKGGSLRPGTYFFNIYVVDVPLAAVARGTRKRPRFLWVSP